MEDIDSSLPSPQSNPLKRPAPSDDSPSQKPLNLKGSQFHMPTPPDTDGSTNASLWDLNAKNPRHGSPSPSLQSLSSIDVSTTDLNTSTAAIGPSTSTPAAATNGPPPAKKRKLTPAEKIERSREKEVKAKEKAEKQAKKEEEKRVKEEEKRVRDEEKREKAEAREAKKREKDLEEQRKTEAKMKKERSQMRLGAFFGGKQSTPKSDTNGPERQGLARRKSLSLEPFENVKDQITTASPSKKPEPTTREATPTPEINAYKKYFLPFVPASHSTVAPLYRIHSQDDLAYWQGAFDADLKDPSFQEKVDLGIIKPNATLDHVFATDRSSTRGLEVPSVRLLVDLIQGTCQNPVDLTKDAIGLKPLELLQAVPRRHIEFAEDWRPAYSGTFTQIRSAPVARKLGRSPFAQLREDYDYDYDSEADWEDPNDGEDILGDDEEEAESLADVDEMSGFLDDEDDAPIKRKLITGDLVPSSTGVCWVDGASKTFTSNDPEQEVAALKATMQGMSIGVLLPDFTGESIDPFSSAYWQKNMGPPGAPVVDFFSKTARTPLKEKSSNSSPRCLIGAAPGEKGPITIAPSANTGEKKRGRKPATKTLTSEQLNDFKDAVVDSQAPKLELQKALKARFPKITNEVIKDTLGTYFAQQGSGQDKKWIWVGPASTSDAVDCAKEKADA